MGLQPKYISAVLFGQKFTTEVNQAVTYPEIDHENNQKRS
jgi:hypothetical protein